MPLARRLVALSAAVLVAAGCSSTPTPEPPAATGTAPASPTERPTQEQPAPPTDTATDAETGDASGEGASRTARGELVEGFPTDVIAVPRGATITLSTIVREGDVLAVSVAGETSATARDVIGDVRRRLRQRGFTEAEAPQPEGGAAATFVRSDGAETVNVTVLPGGGVRRFTIGGQLSAD